MKALFSIVALSSCLVGVSQVLVDVPVQLSGTANERVIIGIADPLSATNAITVSGAVINGSYSWATAIMNTDTIVLIAQPVISSVADGLLIRFSAPSNEDGPLYVKCITGMPAVPLFRPDGLSPVRGQVEIGTICEVLYAGGSFILLNASEVGCPNGFLPATERLCMEVNTVPNMLFHPARDRCANLGGKLCTWAEMVVGCTVLGTELQGQFSDWEWIDDTSNHSHGADLFGRLTCGSQRNVGALTTFTANSRCCYHPR